MIVLKLAPKEGFLNVQRWLGGVRYTDIAPLGLGKTRVTRRFFSQTSLISGVYFPVIFPSLLSVLKLCSISKFPLAETYTLNILPPCGQSRGKERECWASLKLTSVSNWLGGSQFLAVGLLTYLKISSSRMLALVYKNFKNLFK